MRTAGLMRGAAVAALILSLAACGQSSPKYKEYADASTGLSKPIASPMAAADAGEPEAAAADAGGEAAPHPSVPAGAPMLAYSYRFGIEAAAAKVRALEASHEAACVAAGPTVCQVTGSSVSENGDDTVAAQLTLRAAPVWLNRFKARLPGDAKAADGRMTASDVTSEDLSRQIVDTEAAVRAKTTLRDRLQALLASHPGKLSDLLDLERELARVQGEIDATQSELAMMRARVAASDVTISYASKGSVAARGVWSPLIGAFGDFFGIVAYTLGGMIRFIAWTAPWLLVLGGGVWLLRRRLGWMAFWRRKPPVATPPSV